MDIFNSMLKRQYGRTMRESYAFARAAAKSTPGCRVLDCGSGVGRESMSTFGKLEGIRYVGLEWNAEVVDRARATGLDVRCADLNVALPIESESQDCVIAYSVVEHLLMPCSFIAECHRVLARGGKLVLLTPNISTYFTALQVLLGRMPSSGPHPDSNKLILVEQPAQVSDVVRDDVSAGTPEHRHLIVFSYKVLRKFLTMTGFSVDAAKAFGYYPMPRFLQPLFERIDAAHCHQMVFVCSKR